MDFDVFPIALKADAPDLGDISMYAVIRTGGKQYRVAPGDVIRVESQSVLAPTGELSSAMCWRFRPAMARSASRSPERW